MSEQPQEPPMTPPDREREARAVATKIVVRSCTGSYGSKGGCVQNLEFLEGEITTALLQAQRAAVTKLIDELESVWADGHDPDDKAERIVKWARAAAIRQRVKNLT